jgi:Major Facilitator Superfamily
MSVSTLATTSCVTAHALPVNYASVSTDGASFPISGYCSLTGHHTGAAIMAVGLVAGIGVTQLGSPYEWPALLGLWFAMGLGYSMTLTPSGRLLKRSANPQDRPAVFAARFSLSHCCWLITYPLAGQLGARFGMTAAFAALATITAAGLAIAWKVWPANDQDLIVHTHANAKDLQEHFADGELTAAATHSHPYMIDDHHPRWPGERG